MSKIYINLNKNNHCKVLVSCSDLIDTELHANSIKLEGTARNLREAFREPSGLDWIPTLEHCVFS